MTIEQITLDPGPPRKNPIGSLGGEAPQYSQVSGGGPGSRSLPGDMGLQKKTLEVEIFIFRENQLWAGKNRLFYEKINFWLEEKRPCKERPSGMGS